MLGRDVEPIGLGAGLKRRRSVQAITHDGGKLVLGEPRLPSHSFWRDFLSLCSFGTGEKLEQFFFENF